MIGTRWEDNEEILTRFRHWLAETGAEIDSLDDSTSERSTPAAAIERHPPMASHKMEALSGTGLLQVAEALTAMRHELKLETRGARELRDLVQTTLEGLEVAGRRMESIQPREREAVRSAVTPIIEDLIALDEAFTRGAAAFSLTHKQMTETAPNRLREELDARFARLPWWRRRLSSRWHRVVREQATAALARITEEEFAAVMQGFDLIHSRIERALQRHDIRRTDCVGRLVDPTRMSVVELVDDPHAEPETVIEEVRPGYLWDDRVIRFAEVRAVANRGVSLPSSDTNGQTDA